MPRRIDWPNAACGSGYDSGYRGSHVTANRVEPAIERSAAALVEKSNFGVGHYGSDALVLEVRRQIEVV